MVVLPGSIARQLGASPRGQLLAAIATACCAQYLGAMHELTTTVPDFLFWTVLLWLVTRLLASGNPRWWLAIGATSGIAMTAKWNVGFLFAAGAAELGPRLAGPGLRRRAAVFGLAAVISGVISLPLLPAAALARFPVQKINYDLGEEIGWPSQVTLLASVWHSLPATER